MFLHAVIVTERREVASCLERFDFDLKLDLINFVATPQIFLKAGSRETLLISQVFFNYKRTHESPTQLYLLKNPIESYLRAPPRRETCWLSGCHPDTLCCCLYKPNKTYRCTTQKFLFDWKWKEKLWSNWLSEPPLQIEWIRGSHFVDMNLKVWVFLCQLRTTCVYMYSSVFYVARSHSA